MGFTATGNRNSSERVSFIWGLSSECMRRETCCVEVAFLCRGLLLRRGVSHRASNCGVVVGHGRYVRACCFTAVIAAHLGVLTLTIAAMATVAWNTASGKFQGQSLQLELGLLRFCGKQAGHTANVCESCACAVP